MTVVASIVGVLSTSSVKSVKARHCKEIGCINTESCTAESTLFLKTSGFKWQNTALQILTTGPSAQEHLAGHFRGDS